jgi:hypothetical protein
MPSAMKTDGPLKVERITYFETLGTANPPTEDYIPQDPTALCYQCDNVKSRNETGRAVCKPGTEVSCLCII